MMRARRKIKNDDFVAQEQMTVTLNTKKKYGITIKKKFIVLRWIVVLVLIVIVGSEIVSYWLLNQLDLRYPIARSTIADSSASSRVAIVSLHRGFKFHGYLGHWLSYQKLRYAQIHSYTYFDESQFPNDESQLFQLSSWQSIQFRKLKFDKLRYLLYLMKHHPKIEYWLWMDGDSIVTTATISIDEQIHKILALHTTRTDFCVIWAKDSIPNTGIMILVNTPTTRLLLEQSLLTFSKDQTYMDQSSLTTSIQANQTYTECQILLQDDQSTLLQSRVRGKQNMIWTDGDFILHLPNHNRLEMISSLSKFLPKL